MVSAVTTVVPLTPGGTSQDPQRAPETADRTEPYTHVTRFLTQTRLRQSSTYALGGVKNEQKELIIEQF